MTKHLTKPIRAIHFVVLAFLMTIGSQVSAFDPADLQRLIDTKKCSKCYLTDTDLYRANLAGANLAGANLAGANMAGSNLKVLICVVLIWWELICLVPIWRVRICLLVI